MERNRRSIRLDDFDYSQSGSYFITICAQDRECMFGTIQDDALRLNACGNIARRLWLATTTIRQNVSLGSWIIMPNHMHGIITIKRQGACNNPQGVCNTPEGVCNTPLPSQLQLQLQSPSQTIGSIVRGYKSAVTHEINRYLGTSKRPVWQRNYWEHIIRDSGEYARIEQYINGNVENWNGDTLCNNG